MGPVFPRLGAFRCGGLRLAVALTFGPRKGGAPPEGHGNEDCAVDCGSSCTPRFSATVRRVGGSRAHGVAYAVLQSFLGVPGLRLVRSAYLSGALDALWAPSGLLGIHHGGLAITGISRVRAVAAHLRLWRAVGGVVWRWS